MTDIQLQIATLTQQLQECKLANHDFAAKYAKLKADYVFAEQRIRELEARCERYRLRDLAEEEKFRTCLTSGLDEEQKAAEKRCLEAIT